MRIVKDPTHIENHAICMKSFRSISYADMKGLNKEVCEQFNSLLRSIQKSVTLKATTYYEIFCSIL